jgi:predicted MFS family arabinose efflux permease
MSEKDRIKEEIGWLKVVFGILTAIAISLVGFLATSYHKADFIVLVLTLVLVIFISFGIIVVNKKAFDKIDKLEDL